MAAKPPSTRPTGLQPLDEDAEVNPESANPQNVEFVELSEAAIKQRTEGNYKELYEQLLKKFQKLREKLDASMQDSYEVTEFLRSEISKCTAQLQESQTSHTEKTAAWEAEREALTTRLEKKDAVVRAEFQAREQELQAVIGTMNAKVAALERFRDAQEEVEQELAAARKMANDVRSGQEAREAELERKYIEQGAKLKKDFEAKLDESRRTAQESLEERLDVTARHTLLQNRRIAEELLAHVKETDLLQIEFQTLQEDRDKLKREVELKELAEKQMAARGGKQSKQIKEGGRKLSNMERTMAAMLQQFEEEKEAIRQQAAEANAAALTEADSLRRALALSRKELEHVRRLGREVLAQRTMCERFLIDSINLVRRELADEQQRLRLPQLSAGGAAGLSRGALGSGGELQTLGQGFFRSAGGSRGVGDSAGVAGRPGSQLLPSSAGLGAGRLALVSASTPGARIQSGAGRRDPGLGGGGGGALGSAGGVGPPGASGAGVGMGGGIDIADLSWEDRERVLRLVFAKINETSAQQGRTSSGGGHPPPPAAAQSFLLSESRDKFFGF